MIMPPRLRKFALTAHVTFSVGWLGAVAGFLSLAVTGLTNENAQSVRAAYLAMDLIAWFVIVPLALASLLTGIVQALGTQWGLFRHYWVLTKLLLTIFATIVLLLKMGPINYIAGVAAGTTLSSADLREARMSLVAHAGGGLLVLLVATVLSVFKPWGRTGYGRRKQQQERRESASLTSVSPIMPAKHHDLGATPTSTPPTVSDPGNEPTPGGRSFGLKIFLAFIGVIVMGFVVLHLTGYSLHGH